MFDLILKGGEVFDGSGTESIIGDVAIKDGYIKKSRRKKKVVAKNRSPGVSRDARALSLLT